ncbi:CPBP family intramembrane glutamic endopeptidase [Clostridium sp.]|uniref:CPBP family intramembrane glutamic endopeptidase n=1 Tax=Clostridium sp. TaxID=1506 RepID=UPI00261AD314|nr:CPBP family intramembrane glutamic endopeptidase [Clostridium sp.]
MKKFFKTLGFVIGLPILWSIILGLITGAYIGYYSVANKVNISLLPKDELMKILTPVNYKLTLIGDVTFLIILFLIFLFTKEKLIRRCRFHKLSLKNIGLISLTSIGIAFLIILLMQVFSSLFPSLFKSYEMVSNSITASHGSFITLLGLIVLIPIFEEIFFRGVIFGFLRDNFKFPIALIVQALIFGIAHGNLVQGTYAFILGLFLGIVFYYTDSLFASITAHITYNLFGVLLIPMLLGLSTVISPLIILLIEVVVALFTLILGGRLLSKSLRSQANMF